jgi:prepilin-type N-terminal cleavage/methylation domain-containing protein
MRSRRGFTLLELLLVISLLALIMGVGAGLFTRIDMSDRVARPLVENALRSAHNWAIARGAPARVRLDPRTGSIDSEGLSVVGTWHFESLPARGAFGLDSLGEGGTLIDEGFQGKALSFAGLGSRSGLTIPVVDDPAFDLSKGFAVRCAVRRQHGAGGSLLQIGGVVGIDLANDGSVSGWFTTALEEQNAAPRKGGRISVSTDPGAVRGERWSQLELSYDRRRLSITVDGVELAEREEDARVWSLEGPMVLSPGQVAFPGAIDALVVSAVSASETARLPQNFEFAADVPREIRFRPGGGLDRHFHDKPVLITLQHVDGRKETVRVQPYGTVE